MVRLVFRTQEILCHKSNISTDCTYFVMHWNDEFQFSVVSLLDNSWVQRLEAEMLFDEKWELVEYEVLSYRWAKCIGASCTQWLLRISCIVAALPCTAWGVLHCGKREWGLRGFVGCLPSQDSKGFFFKWHLESLGWPWVLHALIDEVNEAGASLEAERDSSWKKPFRVESSCFGLLFYHYFPWKFHNSIMHDRQ